MRVRMHEAMILYFFIVAARKLPSQWSDLFNTPLRVRAPPPYVGPKVCDACVAGAGSV